MARSADVLTWARQAARGTGQAGCYIRKVEFRAFRKALSI